MGQALAINVEGECGRIAVVLHAVNIIGHEHNCLPGTDIGFVMNGQVRVAGRAAIIIPLPDRIALNAIKANNAAPGLVIMGQHAFARRPYNGFDKQRVVRFFMQHSDANALFRIDFIEIRFDPTWRLRQLRGKRCHSLGGYPWGRRLLRVRRRRSLTKASTE